jgi:SWIM zinc finger
MALAIDKIEALAPDQASLSAAVKLKASSWPLLGVDASATFAWGECQGSGSTPYRVCIQLSDLGYKCTCPSRKFPCKHSLGLMLQFSNSPQGFATGSVPEWVSDWSGRRRGPSEKKEDASKPKASLDEAMVVEPEKPRDAASEARAAAQREKNKTQREDAILAGLDELDRWIEDALNRGLAGFMGEAAERCRTLAQRLTDAKAPALATALDALPGQIMEQPEHQRQAVLIEALGDFHLLAQAYRRQDKLPEGLRQDVRRLVGWTMARQELLEEPAALRVSAQWTVIACQSEIQPDKMRRTETWLIGEKAGETHASVLFDFVPVAAASNSLPFLPGERFDAELAYYPSAAPLRAIIAQCGNQTDGRHLPDLAFSLVDVLNRLDEKRIQQPWLRQWPISVSTPKILRGDKSGLWLRGGDACIPLSPKCFEEAFPLTGTTINKLTGLWDGRHLMPTAAETSWGLWFKS